MRTTKISSANWKSKGHKRSWLNKDMTMSNICSFAGDDEILVKKGEMERCNEEEKELLMRLAKEIRYHPERISPNLRYIDRKKVRAATMKTKRLYLS